LVIFAKYYQFLTRVDPRRRPEEYRRRQKSFSELARSLAFNKRLPLLLIRARLACTMDGLALKRKLDPSGSSSSRKKFKQNPFLKASPGKSLRKTKKGATASIAVSVNDLPWKTVRTQGDVGGFGDEAEGGMLILEEVEDVEVVYGQSEGGKIVGFKVSALLYIRKEQGRAHELNSSRSKRQVMMLQSRMPKSRINVKSLHRRLPSL
jgi:hypothetical protein